MIKDKFKLLRKYIFIFILVLISTTFLLANGSGGGDVLWNYGFSYAISRLEIPYKDFNMVITPFYPFLMSLGLHISKNMIIFFIENAFIITFMYKILFKLYGNRAWLTLPFLVYPIPVILYPSYNTFCLILLLTLLYLEKEKKNDYLIGFIIGLSILTKHTVGIFYIIPSLIYCFKQKKQLLMRIVGCLIPCFIFFIYLFITKSLTQFIDLCILGLFDFSSINGYNYPAQLILGIVLIMIPTIIYIKNKLKEKTYLYIILFSSIMLPIFDIPHIEYFVFTLLLLLIDSNKIKNIKNIHSLEKLAVIVSIIYIVSFFYVTTTNRNLSINYPNEFKNFNYRLLTNSGSENEIRRNLLNYMKENQNKKIIFLATDAYFYKIASDKDIDYFDLNNMGNHGYNGTKKMKKQIDNLEKGTLIIIDEYSYNYDQYNTTLSDYAISKSKKIKEIGPYSIYNLR